MTDRSWVPLLLTEIRRYATLLLEQTAEVEEWVALRRATHREIDEHLYAEMCDCDSLAPSLCDRHATVMLMVGGPMDGHVSLHRFAGDPPPRWVFALPQPLTLGLASDPAELTRGIPRAEYTVASRVGGYGWTSRVWTYRCDYADDVSQGAAA